MVISTAPVGAAVGRAATLRRRVLVGVDGAAVGVPKRQHPGAERFRTPTERRTNGGKPLNEQENLSRAAFWALLTPEEREPLRDLAEQMGPLEWVEGWRNDDPPDP